MNNLEKYVRDMIGDRLEYYEGYKQYICDLAYCLFESENVDGTITYNSYKSQELIKEYFDDIAEEIEENIDSEYLFTANPFIEPEKFLVQIVLSVAVRILAKCNFIDKNWDNEIELTNKNINIIKKELEELN